MKQSLSSGTRIKQLASRRNILVNPLPKYSFVTSKIMRTLLYIFTILFLTISCKAQKSKAVPLNNHFDILHLPTDSTAFYFKTKHNRKDTSNNAIDSFVNKWYSNMLFNLKEPIIKDYQGEKEIYRFTWLRTFHHPVSVRFEKQGGIIMLFAKVSNGAGGYKPRRIIFDTSISLTSNEYNLLTKKVADIDFWNQPTEERDDDIGIDGSEWIIEAVKNNKYHMVTRYTPSIERQGNFRRVGEYLISISKISNKETEHFY